MKMSFQRPGVGLLWIVAVIIGLSLTTADIAATPDDISEVDTVAVATPQEVAMDLYRQLKFRQMEDDYDAAYYNAVIECDRAAMAALDASERGTSDYDRMKGILRDINSDLEAGAFYFSSNGDAAQMTEFARAYVDTHAHPAFEKERFNINDQSYPAIVYIAASGAYNNRDFERAITYFKIYFSTGESSRREQVYMYMGQACLNAGKYDLAVASMLDAIKAYPSNQQLINLGIKACIDGAHSEHLQELLDKGLALNPDDEQLLNIQGKLLEDEQEYLKALAIYGRLDEMKPDNLRTARHIALCYYNLGVSYFNQAIMSEEEKTARKLKRQSNDYFSAAAGKLEEVVASDPMSAKYLKALAVAYGCMDNRQKFDEVNVRIRALGEKPMESTGMPPLMSYNEGNTRNYGRSDGVVTQAENVSDVPLYSDFAKAMVEKRLAEWTRKGEFERTDEYLNRVNDVTILKEYESACKDAEKEYLDKYSHRLRLSDLRLQPYDASNEVYLIESSYGPIHVKVPLKNNEAEMFKSNWAGVQIKNPRYVVVDNEVKIAALTFVTPMGKSYVYNNEAGLRYSQTAIDVDFGRILAQANQNNAAARKSETTTALNITQLSDVDKDIPETNRPNPSTIALVIANENYSNVAKVESAHHDGEVLAEYLNKTLGLPKENIILRKDVTLGNLMRVIAQVKNTVKSMGPGTDLIVYYAGHGMPDEATKDAFLLPVDGDALASETCYSLGRFYNELSNAGADNVMVFIDACFSGAQRGDGMLASARAVSIKPKESVAQGNMFTLSATSGQETALPYREKNHGLFTYYLLKKLQQTAGDVTLKDLAEDVKTNVSRQSNLINQKPQTPQVTLSGELKQSYTKKKLRKK